MQVECSNLVNIEKLNVGDCFRLLGSSHDNLHMVLSKNIVRYSDGKTDSVLSEESVCAVSLLSGEIVIFDVDNVRCEHMLSASVKY